MNSACLRLRLTAVLFVLGSLIATSAQGQIFTLGVVDTPDPVTAGQPVTYVITVTNTSAQPPATGQPPASASCATVSVSPAPASGFAFSGSPSGCAQNSPGTVTCPHTEISPQQSASFQLSFRTGGPGTFATAVVVAEESICNRGVDGTLDASETTTVTQSTPPPASGSISKVSGDTATVSAGAPVTLVAQLGDAQGQPVAGVTVSWGASPAGAATLASPTTVSGSDGRASNTVVVRAPVSEQVTASAAGFGSATFTLGAGLAFIPGLNPAQQAVAANIDVVCPSGKAAPQLQRDCNALYANSPDQPGVATALGQVTSEKFSTQGTTTVNLSATQFGNIGARLAALRGGATGISLERLSFNLDGLPLSGAMLAALTPKGLTGGAASADEQSPFGKLGIFVNGNVSFGNQSATNREAGFGFNTTGVTAGADYRLTPDLVLGGAFGYASSGASLDNSGGSLDTKDYSLVVYGTYYRSQSLYADGFASYGWSNYDSRRRILYSLPTVDVNQTANGSTDGTQYSLSLGAGYDFSRQALTVGPYGHLTYLKANIGGFQENIDSSAPGSGWALKVNSQDITSLTTRVGGQASYAVSRSWGVLVPQGRLEWLHEFEDNSYLITSSFVQDSAGVPFSVPTDTPDRDYFNLGVGLSAVFPRGRSAFINYDTVLFRNNLTQHFVTAGIRLEF